MDQKRVLVISEKTTQGSCIVYVMSRDQRVNDNHALLEAQQDALDRKLPLIVAFFVYDKTGVRSYEHAAFMLEGLKEVARSLEEQNIPFVMHPANKTTEILRSLNPAALYFDFSPLNGARNRIKTIAREIEASVYVVDTHNIIPVWVASDKQEFAAHTFRPKVHRLLQSFLIAPLSVTLHPYTPTEPPESLSFEEAYAHIESYPKRGVTVQFAAGESAARNSLGEFISKELKTYAEGRNNIALDHQSNLSPYLHFGQLSSLRVALEVVGHVNTEPLLFQQSKMPQANGVAPEVDGMNTLLEELIVRKELSDNFCFYGTSYTSLSSVAPWAVETLRAHANDPREYLYTLAELESATTHDEAWNAAQRELTRYGKIHGYMRMYWAKKILEWTERPEKALEYAIYLNDAYSIDGGDPNGYVGILWAIAGLHDRPWTERPIFGKIRYMNYAGLKRKFDVGAYIQRAGQ